MTPTSVGNAISVVNENPNEILLDLIRNGGSLGDIETAMKSSGVDLDYVSKNGDTALRLAVRKRDKDIIKLLYKNGANFNLGYRDGDPVLPLRDTALHLAVNEGHIEIIELLLECLAHVDIKNVQGTHTFLFDRSSRKFFYFFTYFNLKIS